MQGFGILEPQPSREDFDDMWSLVFRVGANLVTRPKIKAFTAGPYLEVLPTPHGPQVKGQGT